MKKFRIKTILSVFSTASFLMLAAACASSSSGAAEGGVLSSADASTYVRTAPDVSEEMLNSEFWIKRCKNPDKTIMTLAQISIWNETACDTVLPSDRHFYIIKDLRKWDRVITGEEIRSTMISYNPSVPWYKKVETKNGTAIHMLDAKDFKVFWKEMNLEKLASWKEWINQKWIPMSPNKKYFPVKKAVCVRRSNLRLVPEENFYSDDKEYWYDDAAQNSGILMNEPVLVLWKSADENWVYVASAYCTGWMKAEDVAYCSSRQFERYFDFAEKAAQGKTDFVTVTTDRFLLSRDFSSGGNRDIPQLFLGTYLHLADWDTQSIKTDFGQRVPYSSWLVEIPFKKSDGTLGIRYATVPLGICCKGLLPYTQRNVLNLAFAELGQRYGWGGMAEYRDCSEYLKDIFRCFGFNFPRNSRSQLAMPGKTKDFSEKTPSARKSILNGLEAGTVMGFPGHVLMYLGKVDGKYYSISALGSYYEDENFEQKTDANSVNVNTLDVKRKTGKTWLETLTAAKLLEDDGTVYSTKIKMDTGWDYSGYSKINSGNAVLYKAPEKRKNITVAVNAGHGTSGGENLKTWSHPDKSAKITSGTNASGATVSKAVSQGMKFSDGTEEAEITLRVARMVKEKLLDKGFDVLMLRDGDDVQLDNIARTVIANNCAQVHISIHFDSDGSKIDKGCFYCSIPEGIKSLKTVKKHWKESERLGQCFVKEVKEKKLPLFLQGFMEVDLTQTSYSTIPTVDLELGNQNTPLSAQVLEKRAAAIADCVENFYKKKI